MVLAQVTAQMPANMSVDLLRIRQTGERPVSFQKAQFLFQMNAVAESEIADQRVILTSEASAEIYNSDEINQQIRPKREDHQR